jgi:hypothetical protein
VRPAFLALVSRLARRKTTSGFGRITTVSGWADRGNGVCETRTAIVQKWAEKWVNTGSHHVAVTPREATVDPN